MKGIMLKPKQLIKHNRVMIDGTAYPVRYMYYGNIHRNYNHGGILCLAIVEYDNKLTYSTVIVPDRVQEPAKYRNLSKPNYHVFEKTVVRDMAWVRLNAAVGNGWDEQVIKKIIDTSRVTFRLADGSSTKITPEAIKMYVAANVVDVQAKLKELFSSDEFIESPTVDDMIDVIRSRLSLDADHTLPKWVATLDHARCYKHIDGIREQDIHDLYEDAQDIAAMQDIRNGNADMIIDDEIDELLSYGQAEYPRIVKAKLVDLQRIFGQSPMIVSEEDPNTLHKFTEFFALGYLRYTNNIASSVNVVTEWYKSIEELTDEAESRSSDSLYAAGKRVYDYVSIKKHAITEPESDDELEDEGLDTDSDPSEFA